MADYNVNMKQWNATSFDHVLPLAYNALALNGKTSENIGDFTCEIFRVVSYSNTLSVVFPRKPKAVIGVANRGFVNVSEASVFAQSECWTDGIESMFYEGTRSNVNLTFSYAENSNTLTFTLKAGSLTANFGISYIIAFY